MTDRLFFICKEDGHCDEYDEFATRELAHQGNRAAFDKVQKWDAEDDDSDD